MRVKSNNSQRYLLEMCQTPKAGRQVGRLIYVRYMDEQILLEPILHRLNTHRILNAIIITIKPIGRDDRAAEVACNFVRYTHTRTHKTNLPGRPHGSIVELRPDCATTSAAFSLCGAVTDMAFSNWGSTTSMAILLYCWIASIAYEAPGESVTERDETRQGGTLGREELGTLWEEWFIGSYMCCLFNLLFLTAMEGLRKSKADRRGRGRGSKE